MWESPAATHRNGVTMMKSNIYSNYSGTLYTDLIVGLIIHTNLYERLLIFWLEASNRFK